MKTPSRGAEKFKLRLHPLFFLSGVLSAFTGDFLLFVCAVICALEHELAHSFAARRLGFCLNKIVLMPYGAVISGDISGMGAKEELVLCLAGPLANGLTALGFVALWWLYPETYPYTDAAAYVSASLFFVNLLPAFPLDGGRMLKVLLRPFGEKRAGIVCRILSLSIAAGIVVIFFLTLKTGADFKALFFAALLVSGSFRGGTYERRTFTGEKNFRRGIEEKRIALSAETTAGEAMRFLRDDRYLVLILFEGTEFVGELPEEELLGVLNRGEYAKPLKACLGFC